MTNELQLSGLNVTSTFTNTPLGLLKEVIVMCDNARRDLLISEGVKRGIPFKRIADGVKFNFWK